MGDVLAINYFLIIKDIFQKKTQPIDRFLPIRAAKVNITCHLRNR